MSNRFVVTINDFPITGVSHPTAEEAGRKEGDGANHPSYSVAELVPVKEIEELRASAAGEKMLAAQVGEQDRQEREAEAPGQLREQRLWEAYLSLQGQDFDSDGMQMLTAESAVEFFEERHGQEVHRP